MRQIDPDTNQHIELHEINSDELDQEIRASQTQNEPVEQEGEEQVTYGRGGRKRVPVRGTVPDFPADGDDSDEDDEDFGQGEEDEESDLDDEDGEDDMEDDVDEKVNKNELKFLQKDIEDFDKKDKKKK